MNKINRLRLCNLSLMVAGLLATGSSVQMEACGGRGWLGLSFATIVGVHCSLGLLMLGLVATHLYLHFGRADWLGKMRRQRNRPTRWLGVLAVAVVLSGVAACVQVAMASGYTSVGGVHGKVGFLFLLVCLGHTAKRWGWVRRHLSFFR